MLKSCWNTFSKRTVNWGEIRVTIEDQLTVQRNWNLHPSNSNPDITGLKDTYRSGEENHLGKTGQVRMEVKVVTDEDISGHDGEMQQEVRGFSVKETITKQIVSKTDSDKCKINVKLNKNHFLQYVRSLQLRVNNVNIQRKKTSFARFKMKQRNLFGLELIDTGNLVHSAIV